MKIALVHDYIKEYGGAERVLETLHEMFPEAPVYTAFYSPEYLGPHKERLKSWNIKTTWLQYVPFKNKLLSYFRFIAPWVFASIDLSSYDVVITSTAGTYTSPNFVKTGKHTKLLCYCHTPPRYLYGYATAAPWKTVWWRRVLFVVGIIPMHFLRLLDYKAAQRPTLFIANSEEVKARIEKFYRRDAVVVYPPVDTQQYQVLSIKYKDEENIKYKIPDTRYYLAGGRLARPKHIDLAVQACSELGIPLKVFGKEFSGYGKQLQKLAGKTVKFLGEVNDEEKWKLYAGAKAFIFPAEDEDFGIMPVEAMAVGAPVIAYRSGGVKETLRQDSGSATGVFFNELTVESLVQAIKQFERAKIKAEDCRKQAEKFSKEKFEERIRDVIVSLSH